MLSYKSSAAGSSEFFFDDSGEDKDGRRIDPEGNEVPHLHIDQTKDETFLLIWPHVQYIFRNA